MWYDVAKYVTINIHDQCQGHPRPCLQWLQHFHLRWLRQRRREGQEGLKSSCNWLQHLRQFCVLTCFLVCVANSRAKHVHACILTPKLIQPFHVHRSHQDIFQKGTILPWVITLLINTFSWSNKGLILLRVHAGCRPPDPVEELLSSSCSAAWEKMHTQWCATCMLHECSLQWFAFISLNLYLHHIHSCSFSTYLAVSVSFLSPKASELLGAVASKCNHSCTHAAKATLANDRRTVAYGTRQPLKDDIVLWF